MLKSTSSPLLLFQRKFMLYHQSFSHFLLFIITLCHRKIFTLRIMYYRFLCNFVHCKQFFFSFYTPIPEKQKRKTICVLVCDMMCVPDVWMCTIEMNSLRFFVSRLKIYAFRGEHNWWVEIELWKRKICDFEHVWLYHFCCHLFISMDWKVLHRKLMGFLTVNLFLLDGFSVNIMENYCNKQLV